MDIYCIFIFTYLQTKIQITQQNNKSKLKKYLQNERSK